MEIIPKNIKPIFVLWKLRVQAFTTQDCETAGEMSSDTIEKYIANHRL